MDLNRTWSEAPTWLRVWFVLGAVALVGGISWDRVAMQRQADDFIASFHGKCRAWQPEAGEAGADPEPYCRCLLDGIRAEFGTGRRLARQSRYWTPETLREMGREHACE